MGNDMLGSARARWWWLGIGISLSLGAFLAFSVEFALGTVTVVGGLVAFARSRHRAERLVGLYWIAFTLYSIVFYGIVVRFGFYPFYAAFLIAIFIALTREGVRFDVVVAWLYVAFMFTVAWSFLGFAESIGSAQVQRLLAYLVGPLVALQFASKAGLRLVSGAAVIASTIAAVYVLYSSFEAGFAYRGDIQANPNEVSLTIAFGVVIAFSWILDRLDVRADRMRVLGATLGLGVMAYALMLLASRGTFIALAFALTAIALRAVTTRWIKGIAVLALVGLGSIGLLLPGGDGLVERFTAGDAEVASAGSRIPIWSVTVEALTASGVRELLLGHGFDRTIEVVNRGIPGQTSTHNTYLQVLYEFGIVSLILFVALLGYLAWRAWAIEGQLGHVMLGLTWLLIGANLTDNAANAFPYWMAMGLTAATAAWVGTPARSAKAPVAAAPTRGIETEAKRS